MAQRIPPSLWLAAALLWPAAVTATAAEPPALPGASDAAAVAPRAGYLGVRLDKEGPLRVLALVRGGPAEKAGLRAGDVILKADDVPVDWQQLMRLLSVSGEKLLVLTVQRNGAELALPVRPGAYAAASDPPAQNKALAALDPAMQRGRFGPFADAASGGEYFVFRSPSGEIYPVAYFWEIPGLALSEVVGTVGHHWRYEWDPDAEALNVFNVHANRKIRTAKVTPEGNLLIAGNLFAAEVKVSRDAAGRLVKDGGQGAFIASPVTRDEYRTIVEAELARIRAAKAADEARSAAFWNSVLVGVNALSSATAQVAQEHAAQRARIDALNQSIQQSRDSAAAKAKERIANDQVQPQARPQQQAQSRAMPVAAAPAKAATDDRQSARRAEAAPRDGGSRLSPYPEAIIACSKPDAKGAFRCATPVNDIHGGPGDRDWSTPEAAVAVLDAACPGARRLASTTHLVWGCGFAATNNTNSMDRSSGVDVRGRNTYYCSEKQTSCRRMEP